MCYHGQARGQYVFKAEAGANPGIARMVQTWLQGAIKHEQGRVIGMATGVYGQQNAMGGITLH